MEALAGEETGEGFLNVTSKAISTFVFFSGIVLLALLVPGPAIAHKASVYAFIEDGMVYVEGYFFDSAPCRGCVVEVRGDKGGSILLEGRTDEQGHLEFKAPEAYPLYLKMAAGQGHAASFVLDEGQEPMAEIDISETGERPGGLEDCSGDMEALVDAMVKARMAPLRAEISRLRAASERPGITEIIGGIGYIIGLAGIWLYFRKKYENRD